MAGRANQGRLRLTSDTLPAATCWVMSTGSRIGRAEPRPGTDLAIVIVQPGAADVVVNEGDDLVLTNDDWFVVEVADQPVITWDGAYDELGDLDFTPEREPAPAEHRVVDLMAALEQSVNDAKAARKAKGGES